MYHDEVAPSSRSIIVAPAKAHAVCPEGNERESVASGRGESTICFSPQVMAALMTTPEPCATAMRPHDDVVGTPAAFSIHGVAMGTYCITPVPRDV